MSALSLRLRVLLAVVLTLGLVPVLPLSAQAETVVWERVIDDEESVGITAVEVAPDGSVYVAGDTRGQLHDANPPTPGPQTWVRKYDPAGTLLWGRQFAPSGMGTVSTLMADEDGSVAVVTGEGAYTAVLRRLDAQGNILVSETLPSFIPGPAESDADGNIYLTGYVNTGQPRGASTLVKLDASFTVLWSRSVTVLPTFPGDIIYTEAVSDVTIAPNGDPVIVGTAFAVEEGFENPAVLWPEDSFVRSYSPDGDVQWTRIFDPVAGGGDGAGAVTTDATGGVYVTGRSNFRDEVRLRQETYVAAFAPDGSDRWARVLTPYSTMARYPSNITADQGELAVFGTTEAGTGSNRFLARVDTDGTQLSLLEMPRRGWDYGAASAVAGPGTLVLGASSYTNEDPTRLSSLTRISTADVPAPGVSVSAPVDGATYQLGESVTADYSCQPAGADCSGTVPSGSPLDTASPGSRTFTASASVGGVTDTASVGYTVSTTFAAGLGVPGSVVDVPSGLSLAVGSDPAGMRLQVTGTGTGRVTVTVCSGFTVRLPAGADVVVSCGSVIVRVTSGSAEATTPDGAVTLTVPSGGAGRLQDTGSAQNLGSTTVTLSTAAGATQQVAPGGSSTTFGQTITFAPLPAATAGGPDVPLSATASSGLAVAWTATGPCTIVGGAVRPTAIGTCTVTASQGGNAVYGAAIPVARSFPVAAAVLDTFTRPNGAVGATWLGATSSSMYKITGNALDVGTGGALVWKPSAFGTAQQATITLRSIDRKSVSQGVLLKVQTGTLQSLGGISVTYDGAAKAVRVSTLRLGQLSWTAYPAKAAAFADGDQLTGRVLASGVVEVLRNGTQVATVTLSSGDRTFFNAKGGSIGVWTSNAANAVMDDFRGGTVG
ncbi:hypothetical protein [Oryzobacter terrae]|uniref:hypothetical protein n=1 Tax=Oryzobacter terrae TaxID=1620385 RepID=UPI003672E805